MSVAVAMPGRTSEVPSSVYTAAIELPATVLWQAVTLHKMRRGNEIVTRRTPAVEDHRRAKLRRYRQRRVRAVAERRSQVAGAARTEFCRPAGSWVENGVLDLGQSGWPLLCNGCIPGKGGGQCYATVIMRQSLAIHDEFPMEQG